MTFQKVENITMEMITNLTAEEGLVLALPEETLAMLEVAFYKRPSLEELFGSCLRKEVSGNAPDMMLHVLDEYTASTIQFERIMSRILIDSLGESTYLEIKCPQNGYNYFIDFEVRALIITRKAAKSSCSCH